MTLQTRIDDRTAQVKAFFDAHRVDLILTDTERGLLAGRLASHLVRNDAQAEMVEEGVDLLEEARKQWVLIDEALEQDEIEAARGHATLGRLAAQIAIGIELRAIGAALGKLQDAIEGGPQRHRRETAT